MKCYPVYYGDYNKPLQRSLLNNLYLMEVEETFETFGEVVGCQGVKMIKGQGFTGKMSTFRDEAWY